MNTKPPADGAAISATPRTTLRRRPQRGSYDREVVHAILDEALVAHVAVGVDDAPAVIPTAHVRVGESIYVHGARANRVFTRLAAGADACVAVTILDGLVFARSWFHHSVNYRSVVLYGAGHEVTDADELHRALAALIDKTAPGRSREARSPTVEELAATLVVRIPIVEASAKVRSGPPMDGPAEWTEDAWAGVLPLATTPRPAQSDPHLRPGIALSPAVGARARSLAGAPTVAAPFTRTRGPYTVTTDPARIDFAFVHRFLAGQSYWARDVPGDLQETAMANSLGFGLYEGDRQIGFARVVTDYGRIAYLADVFVAAERRGAGLGAWLVACVLEHPDLAAVPRWHLGTADAHRLYERFGFARAEAGRYMVRATPPR
ncbi:MAG TPA: GNAT family N-acetyltransferase [Polyangiaceae bacterium]|jgi:hypothetical protein|nr:GNAT family N-acetyltransferase [Polyangiaceae bacterium]